MTSDRTIPQGYMTVGEVAKKMGVTVRTLQYYHREGLFEPSAKSEGGRRLYTDKDLIKLHQILSLKSLGFSLENIRGCLASLDTPEEVAKALAAQAEDLRRQIRQLSESLRATEQLKEEVLKMQSVDFKKYADIIVNLQMKNEFYFLIKRFDEETIDHIRNHFDKESGLLFIHRFQEICGRICELQKAQISPESRECQQLAEEYWNMIEEFTGGDLTLLSKLVEFGKLEGAENEWEKNLILINNYMEPALAAHFARKGINPFEGNPACEEDSL